jgi:hypothetical protein
LLAKPLSRNDISRRFSQISQIKFIGVAFFLKDLSDFDRPTDHRLPITEYRLPNTDPPTTDYRLPNTDYRIPTTDYRLLITEYRLKG